MKYKNKNIAIRPINRKMKWKQKLFQINKKMLQETILMKFTAKQISLTSQQEITKL